MATLLTVGETLGVASTSPGTPLETTTHLRLSTAGAEATVAVGMRRLGHDAAWVGVVGTDSIGRRILRELRAEGVDVRFVRESSNTRTGFMLRDHRTPNYVAVEYYRAGLAGSEVGAADVDAAFDRIDDIAIVHLTGITPILSASAREAVWRALERAEKCGATVSFDINYRSTLSSASQAAAETRSILSHVDILFVGDDELHVLTEETDPGAAARGLVALGVAEVVVKRGSIGACAVTGADEVAHVDALSVDVIDTIGAGDSFVAGYLAARSHGLDIAGRLQWATICAACTVGTAGDWEGLPTRAELERRAEPGYTSR